MTPRPAISAAGLGKRYLIRHEAGKRPRYRALRDVIANTAIGAARLATAPFVGRREEKESATREWFWALRDLDFSLTEGEVLGIIGRNGAGKSTLLKLLSRITEPSAGRIELHGRVASLLEVGTGFHPELTGRENIFLNGAVLGMTRAEIRRKFDEIIAFAEVERFLDTPVKRYSSGMSVRLAFAVAAHLEPEILVVDEVLAVGDAAFQKKCLGKMQDVAAGGRTVLFVSHDMMAVERLCQRGIVLDKGSKVFEGTQIEAVSHYLQTVDADVEAGRYAARHAGPAEGVRARVLEASVTSGGRHEQGGYRIGAPLEFRVRVRAFEPLHESHLGIGIDSGGGLRITTLLTKHCRPDPMPAKLEGEFELTCRADSLVLAPGMYTVKLALQDALGQIDMIDEAFTFRVVESDYFGTGFPLQRGVVMVPQEWTLEQ
jgi:lipopolysaccharide transport system ATP-binding protein